MEFEVKEVYDEAVAYNSALAPLLKAKTKNPKAIEQILDHLCDALGFENPKRKPINKETGEIEINDEERKED